MFGHTHNEKLLREIEHDIITPDHDYHATIEGVGNQADFELDMLTQILGYHVNLAWYCTLTVCS